VLLSSRHRRRRELATLASLGLTSRGLRNCVVWQRVGIVAVSAVLGTAAAVLLGTFAGARGEARRRRVASPRVIPPMRLR
jgi:hypothetical protein